MFNKIVNFCLQKIKKFIGDYELKQWTKRITPIVHSYKKIERCQFQPNKKIREDYKALVEKYEDKNKS